MSKKDHLIWVKSIKDYLSQMKKWFELREKKNIWAHTTHIERVGMLSLRFKKKEREALSKEKPESDSFGL